MLNRYTFAIIIIVAIFAYPISYYSSGREVIFTVKKAERITSKDGENKYIVGTDKGVYEVTDSNLYLTWNSSDRYFSMTPGKTYKAHVAGWRLRLTSSYPNIISVEELN